MQRSYPAASRPPSTRLSRGDLRALGLPSGDPAGIPDRVRWEAHGERLARTWRAGEHVSIFAPTGGGKTHLIRYGLLPLWQLYPVLWVRFKQRDATISGMGQTVRGFPSAWDRARFGSRRLDDPRWDTDPEWFVLALPLYRWSPDPKRTDKEWLQARKTAGVALDRAYREGGWVVVVDEVRGLAGTDAPSLSLGAVLENNWQRGRSQPLTVIAGTQQPANAPSSMYDQPTHIYLGKTLDTSRVQRLGEIGGDTAVIRRTLPRLGRYEFLYVNRTSGEMEIVKAPARAA